MHLSTSSLTPAPPREHGTAVRSPASAPRLDKALKGDGEGTPAAHHDTRWQDAGSHWLSLSSLLHWSQRPPVGPAFGMNDAHREVLPLTCALYAGDYRHLARRAGVYPHSNGHEEFGGLPRTRTSRRPSPVSKPGGLQPSGEKGAPGARPRIRTATGRRFKCRASAFGSALPTKVSPSLGTPTLWARRAGATGPVRTDTARGLNPPPTCWATLALVRAAGFEPALFTISR
jgi:hypothetical protein